MGDLQAGCPVEIVEWGAEKEILDVLSAAGAPRLVSSKKVYLSVLCITDSIASSGRVKRQVYLLPVWHCKAGL